MHISPTFTENGHKMPIEKQNWIMACYTAALCSNETIKGILIKTETIENYLKAASTFSEHVRDENSSHWNPIKTFDNNKYQPIKSMLDEHQLWESEMNKRKEVSEEMYNFLQKQRNTDICSLQNAIADLAAVARQAGLRLSEYAQSATDLKKNNGRYAFNKLNETYAFTLDDFILVGPGGNELHYKPHTVLDLKDISGGYIRWRLQKNGTKNETIPYARNDTDTSRCVIRAMLNIRRRAQLLHIPKNYPLGIARQGKTVFFLTDNHISDSLQTAARIVHKIKCKKKLSKYSSHSWRVMACVILYAAHKPTEFIKSRLRWKSECFKMYLRHIQVLGKLHNEAVPGTSFNF